jgi:hypothetical protein
MRRSCARYGEMMPMLEGGQPQETAAATTDATAATSQLFTILNCLASLPLQRVLFSAPIVAKGSVLTNATVQAGFNTARSHSGESPTTQPDSASLALATSSFPHRNALLYTSTLDIT